MTIIDFGNIGNEALHFTPLTRYKSTWVVCLSLISILISPNLFPLALQYATVFVAEVSYALTTASLLDGRRVGSSFCFNKALCALHFLV